jgi:hypothetical protein
MKLRRFMATTLASNVDPAAATVGANFTKAENNLLAAYSLKEGASASQLKALAKDLGVTSSSNLNIRSLQLIAEQRFQHSSHVLNLFSGLLDKVDQLKQRLIAKFAN